MTRCQLARAVEVVDGSPAPGCDTCARLAHVVLPTLLMLIRRIEVLEGTSPRRPGHRGAGRAHSATCQDCHTTFLRKTVRTLYCHTCRQERNRVRERERQVTKRLADYSPR